MKYYQTTAGNWWSLLPRDGNLGLLPAAVCEAPIVGIMKRYRWGSAQPDEIGVDLDRCARHGLRLVAMLEDKSFVDVDGPLVCPDGLQSYFAPNVNGGFTAIRWHPTVRAQYLEDVLALYREFGSHLAFEGVATQETSLGIDSEILDRFGYSPQVYCDVYADLARAVDDAQPGQESRPAKRLFWTTNFIERDRLGAEIDRVLATATHGLAYGCPDVCLTDSMTVKAKALKERVFPRFNRFDGMVKFAGLSLPSQTQDGMTLDDLDQFAVYDLHASYRFWTYTRKRWAACVEAMK